MAAPGGNVVRGTDVSSYNDPINWATVAGSGVKFAYIKATEATYYTNPYYASDVSAAKANGLYVGAYSFARPDYPNPATQADFLLKVANYRPDGRTLPPFVDLEYGSAVGQPNCYGLSPNQMSAWIRDFVNEFQRITGRLPMIYTGTYWWNQCTGYDTSFGNLPLDIANYSSSSPTLPAGWRTYTVWQYTDNSGIPGAASNIDGDVFNGSLADLAAFAGPSSAPAATSAFGPGFSATYHDGRFDVFGVRADGYLTQDIWESGSGWTSWGTPIGGGFQGTPAVTYNSGRYDIFAVGTDGAAYQQTWISGIGWAAGSIPLGGGPFVGGLSATYHDGRFDVFGVRADGYLTQVIRESGSGWTSWGTPIGGGFQGTPAVTYNSGRYDIFAVGTDGAAYQQTWISGIGWAAGSIPLGGGPFK